VVFFFFFCELESETLARAKFTTQLTKPSLAGNYITNFAALLTHKPRQRKKEAKAAGAETNYELNSALLFDIVVRQTYIFITLSAMVPSFPIREQSNAFLLRKNSQNSTTSENIGHNMR
jgi:hypothetical protein